LLLLLLLLLLPPLLLRLAQVVKVLNLEEGGAFTVSSADAIMEALGA
jgi:hypothetical protein